MWHMVTGWVIMSGCLPEVVAIDVGVDIDIDIDTTGNGVDNKTER